VGAGSGGGGSGGSVATRCPASGLLGVGAGRAWVVCMWCSKMVANIGKSAPV